MIVGITGNYCSGKDSASRFFSQHGFTVIDVDKVGYEALEAKREEIVRTFGEDIVTGDRVDRKKLGRIVFSDSGMKKKLESIVHPWMIRKVKGALCRDGDTVINAALLVEMCLFVLCDFVLGIQVKEGRAIERGMARDALSRKEVNERIRAQIPLKQKIQYVDKIIDNNGTIEEFEKRIIDLIASLRRQKGAL